MSKHDSNSDLDTDSDSGSESNSRNDSGSDSVENKPFTLDDIEFPTIILQIGKSKRGKSYNTQFLLSHFLLKQKYFKGGLVFMGSVGLNNDYDFLPKERLYTGYREDVLKAYLEHLKQKREREVSGLSEKKRKEYKLPPTFLVFDDLLGKLTKSAFFDNFLSIYRHYNITIFLNNQFLRNQSSSTLLREQVGYGFFYNTNAESTIKGLYEWFGQLFASYEEFKAHFKQTTKEKYSAMLYIEAEDELEKNYLRYKAPAEYTKKNIKF